MHTDDFSAESIRRTAFFTGHRFLNDEDRDIIINRIYQCISDAYDAGYRRFFCGCALGFDTIAALQTVRLRELHPDVILSLAIPCENQAERWKESDRETYSRILDLANEKFILSPFYYQGAMLSRNRYMADRSSLCICWMTKMRGGTYSAVRYAMHQDCIRIINLAVPEAYHREQLRESTWNCMFISHSAGRNAVTAHLRLLRGRKLIRKNISD